MTESKANIKKRHRVPIGSQLPKRRRRGKRGLYAVPIFLIAVIVGTVLCSTVFFKIETITVKGNTRYTSDQIIAASGIELGDNLIRLKKNKVIYGIAANLEYAETITLKKQLPGEVVITVSEPAQTAIVTLGASNYVLISGKGRILEYNYSGEGIRYEGILNLTIENGFIAAGEAETLARLNDVTAAFSEGALTQITAVGTSSATGNYVVWANRVKILLGSSDDLAQKVKFAKYFIENELGENETGVADVSAGKQLYFDPSPLTEYAITASSQSMPENSQTLGTSSGS
ncbi:MAG TPA: FtsQ-type POTRA domain-containing protein [Oscillospiraceae bacterium]|nr:FtsQ-type POTRA domain-containing protein [Oscillospiraceae bacterium]HPS35407.1 FtsQ-type POTRA domain-containing protein [Oscillospiraceae bacterium]